MSDLQERLDEYDWYHSIDVAPGVTTKGMFDNRHALSIIPFPDLRGKRCLDVGTHDGFVALHMERQGASEVVAIDLPDLTARRGIRCLLKLGGFDVEEVSRYSLLRF